MPRIANAPPENEPTIEVTEEMRDAGANALFEWRDVATAWNVAEEVYLAMERARRCRLLPKG